MFQIKNVTCSKDCEFWDNLSHFIEFEEKYSGHNIAENADGELHTNYDNCELEVGLQHPDDYTCVLEKIKWRCHFF